MERDCRFLAYFKSKVTTLIGTSYFCRKNISQKLQLKMEQVY